MYLCNKWQNFLKRICVMALSTSCLRMGSDFVKLRVNFANKKDLERACPKKPLTFKRLFCVM